MAEQPCVYHIYPNPLFEAGETDEKYLATNVTGPKNGQLLLNTRMQTSRKKEKRIVHGVVDGDYVMYGLHGAVSILS